jgi:hypothetical protein
VIGAIGLLRSTIIFLQKEQKASDISFPTAASMRSFPHRRTHATTTNSSIVTHACDRRRSLHREVRSPQTFFSVVAPHPAHPALIHAPRPRVLSINCSYRPPRAVPAPAPPSLLLPLLCAPASLHLSLHHRPSRCSCSSAHLAPPGDADSRCQHKEKHLVLHVEAL